MSGTKITHTHTQLHRLKWYLYTFKLLPVALLELLGIYLYEILNSALTFCSPSPSLAPLRLRAIELLPQPLLLRTAAPLCDTACLSHATWTKCAPRDRRDPHRVALSLASRSSHLLLLCNHWRRDQILETEGLFFFFFLILLISVFLCFWGSLFRRKKLVGWV